jgi:molecular chaperone DnaK
MSSERVYGIDLGTTYSCLAYVDEHGRPVVVPNAENQLATPSVVFFETEDNIVVGDPAREVSEMYPSQVVSTVKRAMGDPEWSVDLFGKTYRAQDISSFIIRKVVADAEANTGDTIKDVVITVPAYFGLNQKEATKQAGELAGLNVLYVIPEPTAAAIAYGLDEEEDQIILVYDLGGGTFDITMIEITQGAITVLCTGGDHELGGKNWDEAIAEYFADRFEAETGTSSDALMDDLETFQALLNSAEAGKVKLSSRQSMIDKVQHDGERARIELTRDKFDEITEPLLNSTIRKTEELLETAKDKGYDRVDKILLVGGSTYMPQVQKAIEARFPFEVRQFDPNQAVAKGAALFGYKCFLQKQIDIKVRDILGKAEGEDVNTEMVSEDVAEQVKQEVAQEQGLALAGLKKLVEPTIRNVTSKSFGIIVVDENDQEQLANLVVVDDPVPCTVTREFPTHSDGQTGALLRCRENLSRVGPGAGAVALSEVTSETGDAELEFGRPLPRGSLVEITFALGEDGLLLVTGRDKTTGAAIEANFTTDAIMVGEEYEASRSRNLAMKVS